MTGLAIAAPPAGNLGALLGGGAGASSPTPLAGAVAFLDLLGFLGDALPADAFPTEDQQASGEVSWVPPFSLVHMATPKQIAAAVMRSMLQPVEVAAPIVVAQTAVPQAMDVAPLVGVQVSAVPDDAARFTMDTAPTDDWDLPFDWIAPEEDQQVEEEMPGTNSAFDEVPSWVPLPITPVAVSPVFDPSTQVADPVPSLKQTVAVPGPTTEAGREQVSPPRPLVQEPVVSSRPAPVARTQERTAPLAFAMQLTVADPVLAEAVAAEAAPVAAGVSPMAAVLAPEEIAKVIAVPAVQPAPASREKAGPTTVSEHTSTPAATRLTAVDVSADKQESGSGEPKQPNPVEVNRGRAPKPTVARIELPAPVVASPMASARPVFVARDTQEIVSKPELPLSATAEAAPIEVAEVVPQRANSSHEIAVRISAPDSAPVDLQVRERGGAVHVAVRTTDGALQTSLRQDLGSLVDRLEQSGLRAEAVITRETGPRVETGSSLDLAGGFRTHVAGQAEAAGSSGDAQQDRESSGAREQASGGRQQHPQRRQNPAQQQKWLQSMLAQRMENHA